MPPETKTPPVPHRITLDRRATLTISGVDGVERFDESTILLSTNQGPLRVQGSDLHIEKLSLDGGDLLVEGTVDALTYEEDQEPTSFFSRLFRG